jgi:hypothetical protein
LAYFQKYGEKIAADLGWSFDSDEDQLHIWNMLPDLASRQIAADLPQVKKWSFASTPEHSKLSSWFSWNRSGKSQIAEFHTSKMLYEFHLDGSVQDPDDDPTGFAELSEAGKVKNPRQQLDAMRQVTGGIPLAYRLMHTDLLDMAKVMYCCTIACWEGYGNFIKTCKTPQHRLKYLLRGRQQSNREGTLVATVRCSLLRADVLRYLDIGVGGGRLQTWTLDLCLHILSEKWWSDQVRLNLPPECYVGVLGNADTAQQTVQVMKRNWVVWMRLENIRLTRPDALALLTDLDDCAPVRMLHMMFERGKFASTYLPARKLLRGMVDALPDNKSVEDLHLEPKLDSKAKHNRKQRAARIQDKVMNSNSLSSRSINDVAAVSKGEFVAAYKYASKVYAAARHNPSKHLILKSWSKVCGKKTWGTVSEETLRRNSAAFAWLERIAQMPDLPLRVDVALFSRLCVPFSLLRFGDATWVPPLALLTQCL